jgi:transcriptional regulator of aromatic amino acid metabolism
LRTNRFVATFLAKPPPIQLQSEHVRSFIAITEQNIEQNAAARHLNEKELEEVSEGLEKFVMSKIYSKYAWQ